ncbi:hypothetical protein TB1_037078 [Malus domestica]
MSNLRRNIVKMPPVQLSVRKFKAGTIGPVLDPFGLLGRPREWVRPQEWAARHVVYVGVRLGLDSATCWARVGLEWLEPARLGLGPL